MAGLLERWTSPHPGAPARSIQATGLGPKNYRCGQSGMARQSEHPSGTASGPNHADTGKSELCAPMAVLSQKI